MPIDRSKPPINYFHITRTTNPIESFDAQEFHKRVKAARKEKQSRKGG